jgi:hypothetical protein
MPRQQIAQGMDERNAVIIHFSAVKSEALPVGTPVSGNLSSSEPTEA